MKWEKKGLIFRPAGQYPWVITHGMLPIADRINDDLFRIYFSGRDSQNRSSVGFLEININEPEKILFLSEYPVLRSGGLGCFDDNGVTPTWIVTHEGRKYLYYFGWNKASTVRAAEVSGLAISEDGGRTFHRYSRAPIIDRTDAEPYTILVISCIVIENGIWRMWYDSADEWQDPTLPRYNIKYAESTDGIHWIRAGVVSVDYLYPKESRVSRASIVKEEGLYRMWYCYAIGSGGYRMGYAESKDGMRFSRLDDQAGIGLSEDGWDSEMICYPFVFFHKGKRFMLYCGNGYGRTGFGYAVS
ncbi:MAG: hypothetical protein C4576_20360 [Desulfobacteraceae bacterium]|nr:MAG: hypothetical protein C4576_20360 [Desulfobacteraceae bacterium]